MGSNYYPWGPHGERVSPFEVKPNPTPSAPPPHFEEPNHAPAAAQPSSPYRASSNAAYANLNPGENASVSPGTYAPGGIARAGNFLVSLAVVGFLWQFFVCLYPLASLAAGATVVYTAGLLVRYFTPDPVLATNTFLAALIACVAGVVVLAVASRIEQRLARHAAYRIPRHIVRLALFALLAIFAIESASGIPVFLASSESFYRMMFSAPELTGFTANLTRILRTPDYLIAVFVFVVIMDIALRRAERLRGFWHRRLEGIGLRKPGDWGAAPFA
jgi:hypothetical protein